MSSIPVRAESCSEKGVPSGKGSDANPGSFLLRERGSSGLFVFLLLRFFGRVFCRGCRGCPVRSVVRFVFSFACPASRLSDFSPVRLLACPASRLFGFSPVRLLACSASRLSGFLSVLLLRLSDLACLIYFTCPAFPISPAYLFSSVCPVFSACLHFVGAVLLFIFHIFPLCVFLGYRIIFLDELPEMCYNDTIIILNLN